MIVDHYSLIRDGDWPWANFRPMELACRCCGEVYLDPASMDAIQSARDRLNRPIAVNSAHRCGIHNARVGGAPASRHRKLAFDISVLGQDRKDILSALQGAGFSTFGFYQTFIHTDLRPGRRWFGQGADKLWDF